MSIKTELKKLAKAMTGDDASGNKITEVLRDFHKDLTGKDSNGDTISKVLSDLAENYEAPSGGTPFKLISDAVNTMEVANGTFSLQYEGEPPENISEGFVTATLLDEVKGANSTRDIVYQFQSIDTENKTITFHIEGQADGVLNNTQPTLVVLSDEDINFLFCAVVLMRGLPVNYDTHLDLINSGNIDISAEEKTQDYVIDLADYIFPKNVTPAPQFTENDLYIQLHESYGSTVDISNIELDGTELTIKANTLTTGSYDLLIGIMFPDHQSGFTSNIYLSIAVD